MLRAALRVAAGFVFLATVLPVAPSGAQEKGKDTGVPTDRWTDTRGTITVAGQRVDYTATAGLLVLRDEENKPQASVFFTAYNRVTVTQPAPPMGQPPPAVVVSPPDPNRPITFCFNGGPGSSSVWLHMGAFGPRRVVMPEGGDQPPPLPPRFGDNDLSLLDFTDLVFIDPVSTGFSRAAPGVDPKRFHGVEGDVASVGDFIRLYLTRFQRWGSPKYVAGESYGTARAAALALHMHETHGVELSGVLLVSSLLNFGTARFDEGNDLPYALFLPSYTATAHFHKKLPGDLMADMKKALAEAEQFASTEYLLALFKGDKFSPEERKSLAAKLSRLTGLSEDFITRANFRVEVSRFCKELLRGEGRTVGRFDSRLKGVDPDGVGERPSSDPSYVAVLGAYAGAFNTYVRRDLRFETDLKYEVLTNRVQPWDYGVRSGYLNVTDKLAAAMRRNAALRVFVASGYYDLATPYFGSDYTMNHLGLDAEAQKRVVTAYYDAGHMMYTHRPSHDKLRKELAAFYAGK
jgi:carboxypeptidase C (cathepsin A)